MIVGIVNQTVPAGKVAIAAFVEAASAVAGRDAYIAGFTPPLPAADWLGVDTGWSSVLNPALGRTWAWNFGTSTIVQISNPGGQLPFSGFAKTLTLAPTVLVAVPTNDDEVYQLDVRITGRRVDVGKGFGKRMGVTIRRGTGPGSLIVIGSTVLYAHLEAPITWTAEVTPNLATGDIEVVVVGAPTSPVNWWGYVNVVEV